MLLQPEQLSTEEIQELLKRNQKVFNSDVLSANLLFYSTYIAIFEAFKKDVISSILYFFCTDYIEGKVVWSEDYKQNVMDRVGKNRAIDNFCIRTQLMATLDWLFENNFLTHDEYKKIDEIIEYRNKITHAMAEQIYDERIKPDIQILFKLYNFWSRISFQWFVNFELALGIEGLENFEINYDEYSKFNPFALVWLYQNFLSVVKVNDEGFLELKGRNASHE